MAYPFGQMPTWRELRDELVAKHGCTLNAVRVDGAELPYVERVADGKTFTAVMQGALQDDQRLTPSVIRSMCARLGLDVRNVVEAFTAG